MNPERLVFIDETSASTNMAPTYGRGPREARVEGGTPHGHWKTMIVAGYEDANDCDALRDDPAFKMAVGRLPETGAELCSQPTHAGRGAPAPHAGAGWRTCRPRPRSSG
jgi:hypothetical protein